VQQPETAKAAPVVTVGDLRECEHLGGRLDREINVKIEPAQAPQFNAFVPAISAFAYEVLSADMAAKLRQQAAKIREQVKTTTRAVSKRLEEERRQKQSAVNNAAAQSIINRIGTESAAYLLTVVESDWWGIKLQLAAELDLLKGGHA
jgi:hypothetical protein